MKKIIAFITLLVASLWAEAQTTTEISLLPNEKWWGGFTGLGYMMPYQASKRVYNLRTENFNNQSVPYLLSNKGRYIAADTPLCLPISRGKNSHHTIARHRELPEQQGQRPKERLSGSKPAVFPTFRYYSS